MALIEKQSLPKDTLGRGLHDLRISVTDKCNLRCTYCMPADHYHDSYQFLAKERLLTFEEITEVAQAFVELGVSKLRVTGGEPLLRKDLPTLVRMLRELPGVEDLALTTNGILLPIHAEALREAGLGRITVSLDTLDNEVFSRMSGRGIGVQSVLEGIAAAHEAGFGPVKINAVVQRGVNDHCTLELAEYFRNSGSVLRFIEYMDVGTCNGWRKDQVVPSRSLRDQIAERYPLKPLDKNYRGEVAERYAYADGAGEIGFISSVTQPFCGACTRARLSADGQVFTCLFASRGTDLRGPLRAGASTGELRETVARIWENRTDRYSEQRAAPHVDGGKRIEMYQIGG
ncbi:MAG: GTP 3',8-cyclase MoaA [Candidatus Hydrogenedentes bacterium]|nr:GTP 3',8-cyclase MoaA [Candidatus Hydrogenedentota bacterium]